MAERRREDVADGSRTRSPGRLFVSYTLLRLAVFAACTLVLLALGFRELPLVLTAVVLSALVSLVAFRAQRRQLTDALAASAEDRRRRREEAQSADRDAPAA